MQNHWLFSSKNIYFCKFRKSYLEQSRTDRWYWSELLGEPRWPWMTLNVTWQWWKLLTATASWLLACWICSALVGKNQSENPRKLFDVVLCGVLLIMCIVIPWLIDSWSRASDQIQTYPDRDTIAQLLPAHRLCLFQVVFAIWLFKGKSKYITKHLMYGPSGN